MASSSDLSFPDCILITGATGLVGQALVAQLRKAAPHVELRGLSRRPDQGDVEGVRLFAWDLESGTVDPEALHGVGGLFHLAGETVAQRWTPAVRRRIRSSRIDALDVLDRAWPDVGPRPRLVSASAIGWYADQEGAQDETTGAGTGFIADVVRDWEAAVQRFAGDIPHVQLRIGLVLSKNGGVLERLLPLYRLGLGSPLSPGQQWQSWIHIDDLVSLFLHAMGTPTWNGAYNATSPNPAPQAEFSATLARVLRRPHVLPKVPRWALRAVFGDAAEALLASHKILPMRTSEQGFRFAHPDLEPALHDLLG